MRKTIPRVVYSALGDRFYVVTRYTLRETTANRRVHLVAHEKYDVTDDVLQAVKDRRRYRRRRR